MWEVMDSVNYFVVRTSRRNYYDAYGIDGVFLTQGDTGISLQKLIHCQIHLFIITNTTGVVMVISRVSK